VQRGTITTTSGTDQATITAVNMAKAEVNYLGMETTDSGTDQTWLPYLDLTNATTVTASSTVGGATIGYQVVEWN